jgi:YD repeat-containing protein
MTAAVDPRGHELGANPSDYTTTYTRYVYGEVVSVSDPLGHSATVTYDVAGNRTQTADALGRVTQYTYDAAGNLLTSTFPNGWRDERAYDRAARLIDVKTWNGPTLSVQHTYTRDAAGDPTSVQSLGETVNYAYDALDRLTEACFSGSCPGVTGNFVRYAYDTVGNRLNEARPGSTTTYSYNTADQLLSYMGSGGTTTFDYDANGNETRSGADVYAYDAANRQAQATVGALTVTYAYAGDGVRERESWGPAAAEQRVSHWDRNASLAVIALQRDGAGAMIRRFAHGNGIAQMRLAHGVTSGCTQTRRDWFYHTDALGSVVAMTSGEGALG